MTVRETSSSFDLDDVGPFLRRLAAGPHRVSPEWTVKATERIEQLDVGEELRLNVDIHGTALELRAVATDIEVVDLFFRGVPALCEAIDAAMDAFFEERGM